MRNWVTKKLDEVCELITCGVAARPEYVDDGIPFLSAKNVKEGQIIWNGYNCVSEKTHKELTKNNKPLLGDILYTRVGSYGEAAVIENDYEFSVFVSLTLIKVDKSVLNNYFLKHYLNSDFVKRLAKKSISGSGVGNLNVGTVREFPILLPPLPEQQRIVSILDEAFAAIAKAKANAEKNLRNAKELFESYLQRVFENIGEGWEHTRLGDVCKINDGTHFSPKNTSDGEYMYITAKNIKPYYIDLTKISYISEKDHKEIYARCSAVKGDVLYIKDGATAGIATINNLDEEFSLLSSVALLKCSPKIINTFLVHYMNSKIGKQNFLGYLDGAAITRLTLIKIKNVCFSLPPIRAQKAIVQKLDTLLAETQKLEAIYQQKINDLEELKKSVLQKAFSGEL
jgi:type I restriction enzyme S subunit